MGRILTIKPPTRYHNGTRDQILPRNIRIGPVSIKFISIIVLALLFLFYLTQNQIGSSKGYQMKDLDEQKSELQAQNEALELEAAKVRSIQSLKTEAEKLNLVPAQEIIYLDKSNLVQGP